MDSILSSTLNTRPILPDSLRFIRSDVPDRLNEQEIQWLLKENITAIVDLREEEERNRKPCPIEKDPRFRYSCMPVTGGNRVPESVDAVSASYIAMTDVQMDRIVDTIWNASSNVLYFCNAGKDRTGVVSAILLSRAGMDRAYILSDYMKSGENLKPVLEAYTKQFPQTDIQIITPQPRYMEEFLDWYTEKIHKE